MKRKLVTIASTLAALIAISACSPPSDDGGGQATPALGEEPTQETTLAALPPPEPPPPSPVATDDTDRDPILADVPTPGTIMEFNEDITAFELTRDMGAGWNLGNTLDARLDANSPVIPSLQETAWGNPITTREMIELLAQTGFRTLRIPITWERFIGEAPDYIIDTAIIDRVQEIVDWAFEFDMYVIINTHHETWNFPSKENAQTALRIATALWHQVASRFTGYSEKLIFESMNEPRMFGTNHEWTGGTPEARGIINGWNMYFINTIRATGYNNVKRFLMIPTHAASGDQTPIDDMWTPSNDDRVIVSIHAYTPYDIVLNTRSARNTFDPSSPNDTRDIDALFERLNKRFISQGIPVVMGETGMLNKEENTESRVAWAEYYTRKAAELGIPCIWWDNGIRTTTTNEAFGIMNRTEVTWHYPEIAEAFIKNYR